MAIRTLHQRCRPDAPPTPPDTAWTRTTECRGHTMPSRPRRSSPRRCVSPEGAAAEGGYFTSSFHVICVASRHRVSFCAAVHCVMIVLGRSEGSSNSDSVVRRSALKEHPHPNLLPPSSSPPRGLHPPKGGGPGGLERVACRGLSCAVIARATAGVWARKRLPQGRTRPKMGGRKQPRVGRPLSTLRRSDCRFASAVITADHRYVWIVLNRLGTL